jgi:O-antigen/teichoic acid export membrane protein
VTTHTPSTPALGDQPPKRSWFGAMGRATTVMVVLTSLADLCNYGSSIVFSHLLPTSGYGDLTALLAVTTIAAIPTGAAQTVIAGRVAVLSPNDARYFVRQALAHVTTIALLAGVVCLACAPLLKIVLGLQSIGPALAMAPLIVFTIMVPAVYGLVQGMQRFMLLGLMTLAIALSRIAFGVPWTLAGGGAGGPLLGQALGAALSIAVVVILLRRYILGRGSGAALAGIRHRPNRHALAAGAAFIAFALLSNLDVLLAKLFLSSSSAGTYAALVTVEKAVIFLPAAVAVILVPAAAKARMAGESSAAVLRVAALVVLGTIVIAAAIPLAAPHLVIKILFGTKYLGSAGGMRSIVIAGAGLSLLYLLVVYTVTIQDRRWVWLLIGGVVLQIAAISAFHRNPDEIAFVQGCVVLVVLLANELLFHPLLRGERLLVRRVRGSGGGAPPGSSGTTSA